MKVPFLPEVKVGSGTASWTECITLTINLPYLKGTFKFCIKEWWVWLHYDVTVFDKHYVGDVKLIPIPSVASAV